jgi:chemotaxis protein MotB
MKQPTHYLLSAILLISSGLCASSEYTDGVTSERIYFIQEDGRHALVYTTSRSNFSTYSLWFAKQKGYTAENYLEDFHYLYPNSENWLAEEDDKYMALKLPYGDFASLKWANLEDKGRLQVDKDGIYYFRNWNEEGEEKTAEGHYGIWNSPGDFKQIACSWVFPQNLEPVTYLANQKGEWKQRHNTLTYYGHQVNDLFFAIQYRPTSGDAYNELKSLEGEGVEVEQQPTGVKMTLAETLLFPSGVARISDAGAALLNKLASRLKQQITLNVVIAGHTDNVPIGAQLEKRFQSNWELSSKRAINIIHYLVSQGIAETRFEAQAFSFMRPLAPNESEDGRSKNRRIEIMLSDAGQDTSSAQARLEKK